MIIVSDSTPLIHFGTIKRLDLLRSMYGQIVITGAVHREVVTEGVAFGKMDIYDSGYWEGAYQEIHRKATTFTTASEDSSHEVLSQSP